MTRTATCLATCLTIALLLPGCAVGPEYERPAVELPPSYPRTDGGASADTIAADWWTVYGNAELTRLVEKALGANFDIAQAVAQVELAEAQARETGGALLPRVDLGASASRGQLGLDNPNNPAGRTITGNDFRLGLSASYELDFWHRLRYADDAARAQLLGSQAARDTVRLSVAALVAQSWFALRSLDEQMIATRVTLTSREEALRIVGARLKGGTASRLDAEQAEIQRADVALQLRDLQRQRALALSQLAVLTSDAALELPEAPLGTAALPPLPPAGLPSALLERRPDIRRSEEQLIAANAQIGAAKAAMFPTISLTGGLGQESIDLSNLVNVPARFWSFGFGLALPLFDGGRLAARTDQASARQREAVGAYQSAVSGAFKEVADALANLRAARESAADLELRDGAAARAVKLARARYLAGYAGYLEVLDAQRTATAAELDVVRNRQAQRSAHVDLVKALGGGWGGPGGS